FSIRIDHFTHFFPGEGLVDTVTVVPADTTTIRNHARGEANVTVWAGYILADTAAGGDTLTQFEINNAGAMDSTKVASVRLFKDANNNQRFEQGVDTFIANLANVVGTNTTWRDAAITYPLSDLGESFIVVLDITNNATGSDTFQARIKAFTIKTTDEDTGPLFDRVNNGYIRVIDTSGPNIWYVNEATTFGDSFTSVIGDTTNNGLGANSPKRFINQVDPFLTPGDTVYIDSGIFYEAESIVISVGGVALIGVDSLSTIIDFSDSSFGADRMIYVNGGTNHTFRKFQITRGRRGIHLQGSDLSLIENITFQTCNPAQTALYFFSNADSNTVTNLHIINSGYGVEVSGASVGNVLSNLLIEANAVDGILITGANTSLTGSRSISNGGDGISVGSSNNRIVGNLVSGNVLNGIKISGGANDNYFAQNHIDSNSLYAVNFLVGGTSRDTFVQNNFVFGANIESGVNNPN
ncbi:MAG: right-handed parallel beta-helix repeat-containing protein, partial [Bdellovibrionota bacterium]